MRARDARREDHAAFSKFWGELGIDHPPPEVDRWAEMLCPHTFFLEEGSELAAYALAIPLGARGDVRQIVVAPAWRRRGVGRAIMAEVAARLRAAGCRDWRLEVRDTNEPAIALYRSLGMQVLHTIEILRVGGDIAERFSSMRSGRLSVVAVDPADEGELETRFDLGRGQLARWRQARPHGVMYQVRGAALAHYTKDFVPEFGLLFPFRAPDVDHAAHLIAEACSIRTRDELEVFVVDASIGDALRAAGARTRERMFEMGAPLQ